MRHFIIPDTQVTPTSDTSHLKWAAQYCILKKPDVIVHLGDHFDMESLSSYDVGKKSYEGRQYIKDIEAGQRAIYTNFMQPIRKEQRRLRHNKKKVWQPRFVFLLGNHENRIEKAIESDRKLEGLMSTDDLQLNRMGWEVVPFLDVITIDGVAYSHYFTSGVKGLPVSSARLMLNKKHMSCVMGHVQDRDIAFAQKADGTRMTGIFAGIFYQEDLPYLTPQTNRSWRGCWMLNEVKNGSFDEMPLSLEYLKKRFT